jgi:hypothetical protein
MPGFQDRDLREDIRFVRLRADFEECVEGLFAHFLFDGLAEKAAIDEVVGRFKKIIRSANGPAFDDAGYIPPIQICTEAEVVRWFGFSNHRNRQIDIIREWLRLGRAVHARRLLLDGSFVTKKKKPGDVDAVMLLPDDFRDQLQTGNSSAAELSEMFRTRKPKELFAAEDERDWWEWFGFFSRTREANGQYKGLIEVIF